MGGYGYAWIDGLDGGDEMAGGYSAGDLEYVAGFCGGGGDYGDG